MNRPTEGRFSVHHLLGYLRVSRHVTANQKSPFQQSPLSGELGVGSCNFSSLDGQTFDHQRTCLPFEELPERSEGSSRIEGGFLRRKGLVRRDVEGSIVLGRAIDEIASLCGKCRLVVGVGGFQSWDDWLGARGLTRAPIGVLLKEIRIQRRRNNGYGAGRCTHPPRCPRKFSSRPASCNQGKTRNT